MPKIILIFITLLLSLILSILPLPGNLSLINPSWVLLSLFFWTDSYPRLVNVGVAFSMGIMMDVLMGSLLGLHAFVFVVMIYIFDMFYRRFHMFHLLQQSLMIAALIAVSWLIMFSLDHALTDSPMLWSLMFGTVTSGLAWPFYQYFSQKFHFLKG